MLKFILSAVFVFASTGAFAADCVDSKGQDILNQPEVFTDLIAKSKSCSEATQLAQACAWGSSLDVTTAGTAYSVCDSELKSLSPSKEISSLLMAMKDTCTKKYENEQGTMYLSFNAYCHLSAIEWIVNTATPN